MATSTSRSDRGDRAGLVFGRFDYPQVVAISFIFGLFMELLDTTVINVAIPTLQRDFDVPATTIEWVLTGYLLSLAMWIPASGWIGDRFGTKRTFLFALTTFTLASALCGFAWNIESLIAARLLQGVGGGMLTPVGAAMLFRAYPPADRAKASAILSIPTIIAPALGPLLGGLLVSHASWRWIFFINLPIGLAGIAFAGRFLHEHTEPNAGGFDRAGFLLSGGGLALLLYALAEGPAHGWLAAGTVAPAIAGAVCAVLLVRTELRVPEPMLDLRLFGDRMFRQANIAVMALSGAMLGILFLLPLFLQEMRGLDALHSGLVTFPQAIGMLVALQPARRLYPRIGPRRMMLFSSVANAVITAAFALIGLGTSLWWIRGLILLRGMSMAPAMIAMQVASYATISPAKTGRASSLSSADRQIASALCVAVLATVFASRTRALTAGASTAKAALDAQVTAYHQSILVGAGITVLAIVASWYVHDEDAAITMVHTVSRDR